MFGPRLFRSRWVALIWAGGILWTAYDVASAAPTTPAPTHHVAPATDAVGDVIDSADLAAIANAAG